MSEKQKEKALHFKSVKELEQERKDFLEKLGFKATSKPRNVEHQEVHLEESEVKNRFRPRHERRGERKSIWKMN